ncbi:MAG TPA: TadE family protein [Acidimicrobiales bacterium]|nr:TadE family protein [Acidimicrobiales bacterium]
MVVFLVLLLFAVQVLYGLYARSAVTAAAFDGARLAAGFDASGDRASARAAAEAHIHEVLGGYADREGFDLEWSDPPDGRDVVLTVRARSPGFLPPSLRRPMGLDTIERTVRVRVERAP